MQYQHSEEDGKRVRLNFRLCVSQNALLVGDLLGQPKGKLRHARLVTLATIGLLIESRVSAGGTVPAPMMGHVAVVERRNRERLADLSDELLDDVDKPDRA